MERSDRLRQEADEAERIAAIVSYGPDRTRLEDLARRLRQRADALEATRRRSG